MCKTSNSTTVASISNSRPTRGKGFEIIVEFAEKEVVKINTEYIVIRCIVSSNCQETLADIVLFKSSKKLNC
jgi:hypothetical protein